MIELIAAAVSGAVVGGGVVALIARRLITHWYAWARIYADNCDLADEQSARTFRTLTSLRSNCFIPDERGVKVRYSQASVERRVKAETPKEVV